MESIFEFADVIYVIRMEPLGDVDDEGDQDAKGDHPWLD